jgi:hypothetical protein
LPGGAPGVFLHHGKLVCPHHNVLVKRREGHKNWEITTTTTAATKYVFVPAVTVVREKYPRKHIDVSSKK